MDQIDHRIVALLSEQGRMSLRELGQRVGLASPSVAERLRRLEERGAILGYTARIDPRPLGYPVQALVRINPVPGALHEVERMIRETPQFVECDRVTGEDCFVARLFVRTIEDLDAVLDQFHAHARTNTAIVKGQPIVRRLPPF